ncbi:N-acetyltransferase [Microaerobacter geothermalis]|nr:N-acetyltransferase [Microaerobacter geothermalis]
MLTFRKAKMSDVETMHELINLYAQKGLMLARSRNSFYEGLREFTVADYDGQVVGAGGLHLLWSDLAEIRALAIHPDYAGQGIGRKLVETLVNEAKEMELPRVFALTYQPEFFSKCGFTEVAMDVLPHKVWRECINCPKFPKCDERAFVLDLND